MKPRRIILFFFFALFLIALYGAWMLFTKIKKFLFFLISSLNSLVVVAEDQFYVTNYKYANDRREIKYNLRWGTVVFYDGIRGHVVDDGLLLPNGITIMDR